MDTVAWARVVILNHEVTVRLEVMPDHTTKEREPEPWHHGAPCPITLLNAHIRTFMEREVNHLCKPLLFWVTYHWHILSLKIHFWKAHLILPRLGKSLPCMFFKHHNFSFPFLAFTTIFWNGTFTASLYKYSICISLQKATSLRVGRDYFLHLFTQTLETSETMIRISKCDRHSNPTEGVERKRQSPLWINWVTAKLS